MKICAAVRPCAACCKELPKESFSKKQWKLKPYERRCSGCIVAGRAALTKPTKNDSVDVSTDVIDSCSAPSSNNVSNEDEPSCWICLDDGADEGGNPLVRDCSCRGSLGLVHLSCLIEYAKHKTEMKYDGRGTIQSRDDAMKFRMPWEHCPCCLQWYGDNLAQDLAVEFAVFIEEKYAHNKSYILEALLLKLETEKRNNSNAIATGRKILSLIEQEKNENSMLPSRVWKGIEPHVYNLLGTVYVKMGTRENLIQAVECFNMSKEREIDRAFIAAVNVNLSIVEAKLGRRTNAESELENRKVVYEYHVKSYGKESVSAIKTGRCYATHLKKAHKGIAAERLLLELYETSKQVHGADNDVTKEVKISLELMQRMEIRERNTNQTEEKEQINNLPTLTWEPSLAVGKAENHTEVKCQVCQCDYEMGDELRRLPCDHCFHVECIDPWLQMKDTCALCRKSIVSSLP